MQLSVHFGVLQKDIWEFRNYNEQKWTEFSTQISEAWKGQNSWVYDT